MGSADRFSRQVNPQAVHDYAVSNDMEQLSYSLVRACYLRDVRQGTIAGSIGMSN